VAPLTDESDAEDIDDIGGNGGGEGEGGGGGGVCAAAHSSGDRPLHWQLHEKPLLISLTPAHPSVKTQTCFCWALSPHVWQPNLVWHLLMQPQSLQLVHLHM